MGYVYVLHSKTKKPVEYILDHFPLQISKCTICIERRIIATTYWRRKTTWSNGTQWLLYYLKA
jgi:hypothetical protein